MAGIEYQQVTPYDPTTVKIKTIDPREPGTVFLAGQKFADSKNTRIAIAEVIGQTNSDSDEKYATLTKNGYENRELFETAFWDWETSMWDSSLRTMLREVETYIYTAMFGEEIVGAAILIHLCEDFPETMKPPKAPRTAFPDPSDWEAVKAYAMSGRKDNELRLQVNHNLNTIRRQHGLDDV
ncbi:hypothetical protein NPX13_g6798 [Xylaria arbuscula]|uniref:Uncharacterized protein n=1 Tax=Xylaria arbuscula TaxID=114810 RepID=A0A9W8NBV5_9PEZI|nr:hypothetical protein NPX13_g6798 [Xylaria arbuscula]